MAHPEDDDWQQDGPGNRPARAGRVIPARLVNWLALAASLGLVVLVAWWGYRLAMRDVRGVPVIHAMAGPLRMAPENPGGEVSENQGLSVNSIAAGAGAQATPDTLVLAPPPLDFDPSDGAGGTAPAAPAPAAPAASVPEAAAPAAAPPVADATTGAPAVAAPAEPVLAPAVTVDPNAVAAALLAEAPETDAAPNMAPPDAALSDATAAAGSPQTDAATPGTLRPRPRPADLGKPAPTRAPVAEVDPASVAPGTRMVQLGAFDTADQARGEWGRLRARFAEDFADKSMVVQSAVSGGRTFFRLRAIGFADEAAARDFCTTLLKQNAPCIPATQR